MSETVSMAKRSSAGAGIRWTRIAVGLLLVPLLVAAAVLSWVAIDRDGVRRAVEGLVSQFGERPFTIEGEFDYELGRIIRVRAGKIRWRNLPAAASPYMLEIEDFSGSVDLFSLFDWPIVVTGLQASDAKLRFEWDEQAGFNWDLNRPRKSASDRPKPRDPLPLVIDEAAVRNVNIAFRHPSLTEELVIIVRQAEHQQDKAHRLVVSGAVTLDGSELALDGRIGPFPELAVAGAVDLDVVITGLLATLTARGSVSSLAQLQDLKLTTLLEAPSAADLAPRLELPLDTTGRVQLSGDIATRGEGIDTTVRGTFGEYEVDARFARERRESLHGLDADIRSTGPSLRDLAAMAGLPDMPDVPYVLEARARATELGLEIERLRLDASGLRIDASGRAGGMPELRDIDLDLIAEGSDFAAVARLFGLDVEADLPFQFKVAVESHGRGEDDGVDAGLKLGDATAAVTGSLSEAADFSGSRLRFSFDAADANQLTAMLGVVAPARSSLQIQGTSWISAEQIGFDDIEATIAGAELSGSARIGRGPGQSTFGFDGQAKGPNLAAILGPMLPEESRSLVPQLRFETAARLRLAQGDLHLESIAATVGSSKAGFVGRIDMEKPGINLDGELSVSGDSLAELLSGLALDQMPAEAFSLNSRLRWTARSIHLDELQFTARPVKIGGAIGLIGDDYSRVQFDLDVGGENLAALVPGNDLYEPARVPFHLDAHGAIDPAAVAIERFEAQLGDARLALSGKLQLQPTLAAKQFKLQGGGKRLSDLGTFGRWRLTDRPFTIAASVKGGADAQLLEELRFDSGENNVIGRLRYVDREVPFIDIAVESTRLDLDEIRLPVYVDSESSATAAGGDRVFSKEPLPFHLIDSIDAEISLRIDDLITHDRRWRNLIADATIDQGVVEIRQAQVDAAKGKAKLRGVMKPTPAGRNITVEITAADAMIALQEMTPDELRQLPRNAVDARLSATGNSPHELAASLDGFVWVIGGEGKALRTELDALIGDFLTNLLKKIQILEDKDQYVTIVCQAMFLEIDDGTIETSPALVIRADDIAAVASGKIDLASETIDFTFETTPLTGIGVSVSDFVNPFTKLSGTLSAPQIVVDASSRPGESAAAVATVGLTVVLKSLWKSWVASRDVCEKIADEAVEIRTQRDPHNVPDLKAMVSGTDKPEQTKATPPAQRRKEPKPGSILDDYEG